MLTFSIKKVPVFALFPKVAPKSTVHRLSRLVFFGPPKIFFSRTIFLLNLYQSIIVLTFSIKKVRVFALFRKVAPKGTVHRLSRLDFFDRPPKFFFLKASSLLVDLLSAHHSTHFLHKNAAGFRLNSKSYSKKCSL